MCPCDCDRISAVAVNNCEVKAEVFEAPLLYTTPIPLKEIGSSGCLRLAKTLRA